MPWNVKMRKSRLLIVGLQRIEMNNEVINLGFFGSAFFLYSVFDLCIIHTYKDAILRFHEPSISELLFSTSDCVYRLSIYQLPEVRSRNNSLVFRKHENCTAAQGLVFMMLHRDLTTVIISADCIYPYFLNKMGGFRLGTEGNSDYLESSPKSRIKVDCEFTTPQAEQKQGR